MPLLLSSAWAGSAAPTGPAKRAIANNTVFIISSILLRVVAGPSWSGSLTPGLRAGARSRWDERQGRWAAFDRDRGPDPDQALGAGVKRDEAVDAVILHYQRRVVGRKGKTLGVGPEVGVPHRFGVASCEIEQLDQAVFAMQRVIAFEIAAVDGVDRHPARIRREGDALRGRPDREHADGVEGLGVMSAQPPSRVNATLVMREVAVPIVSTPATVTDLPSMASHVTVPSPSATRA